jgi:DNA-binding protein H-NS
MGIVEELLARRAEIDKEIAEAKRQEKSGAIAQVKALMAEHGLTVADITAKSTAKAGKGGKGGGAKVAPKYRNRDTGETWTGRGLQPKWLRAAIAAGAKLGDFAI